MIAEVLAVTAAVPSLLAVGTALGKRTVERRYPPTGHIHRIGGRRLHVREDDAGSPSNRLPILAIHGASGNGEEIREGLSPLLSGRRAIYPDRPGHGWSERGGPEMSAPARQADALADLLDQLGVERAIVIGHSWGASVAAAMAVVRPERVAGLLLLAPATHPWPGGVAWYHGLATAPLLGPLFRWTLPMPVGLATMDGAVREVFAPDPVPERYVERCGIPLSLRPGSFRANSSDIRNLKRNVTAMAPRYREIGVPTGIVTGDVDGVVAPFIHAEALAREIDGAFLLTVPGGGHMPHHAALGAVAAALDRLDAAIGGIESRKADVLPT